MGDYKVHSTKKAELTDSGVTLTKGDIVEEDGAKRYEILRFAHDGMVTFRFVGDEFDEITQGEEGSDLLAVWDNKFRKGEYEIV